jgi:hypothetical protein
MGEKEGSLTSEELPNQLPEVDPPFGNEVEGKLSSIPLHVRGVGKDVGQLVSLKPAEKEGKERGRKTNLELSIDDLHRKSLLLDLLLAQGEGLRFVLHLEKEQSTRERRRGSVE